MTGRTLQLMCMTGRDCLRDEGIGYAELENDGLAVKLHVYASV